VDGADTLLRLFTPATAANPVDAFQGSCTVNKAIMGFSGFHDMKRTDFEGLKFDVNVL
jgi:hypothetical protein